MAEQALPPPPPPPGLKGRERDVERLQRALEGLKAEAHEASSGRSKAEEAAKKLELEAGQARWGDRKAHV